MAKQVTQFDLLISCPSDVKEELEIIKETVESFNRLYGAVNKARLVVKHWSTDSYPQSGGSPQALLNKQFVLDCDAAIAVFWTRFGTPTDEYSSGTEEEIEELIKSGKQVFLYFSDCQINPSSIDYEQYQKVLGFRNKYKDMGIYWAYSNLDDFKKNFLNHLGLYFLRILTNDDKKESNMGSKLIVNGIVNGKIDDKPVVLRRNYSESKFIQNMQTSISELFGQINKIMVPSKLIDTIEDSNKETTLPKSNLAAKIGEIALSWQEQLKGINSIFPSLKAIISTEMQNYIIEYAKKNSIDFNNAEFFNTGDLVKQQQPLGGGPYGTSPSYHLVGSEDEKNKYNLIKKLYWKINEYNQYLEYFSIIDSKYYVEMALSNFGTSYDEDIDVKIYVNKGLLCTKDNLPVPGDNILEIINKLFNRMFKSEKTVSVDEYNDYPMVPGASYIPTFKIGGPLYEDEASHKRNEYENKLETTFCYDYFQEGNYDILRYNLKYIKQNTSVFFPSILVFNQMPDKLNYEISSKHFSELVKGELIF